MNRDFHGQIHDLARSVYLGELAGGMWDRCDFYLASADPGLQGERVPRSEVEHTAIVDALESGDAQVARTRMVAHIESFSKTAVARLHRAQRAQAVNPPTALVAGGGEPIKRVSHRRTR